MRLLTSVRTGWSLRVTAQGTAFPWGWGRGKMVVGLARQESSVVVEVMGRQCQVAEARWTSHSLFSGGRGAPKQKFRVASVHILLSSQPWGGG